MLCHALYSCDLYIPCIDIRSMVIHQQLLVLFDLSLQRLVSLIHQHSHQQRKRLSLWPDLNTLGSNSLIIISLQNLSHLFSGFLVLLIVTRIHNKNPLIRRLGACRYRNISRTVLLTGSYIYTHYYINYLILSFKSR